jgi:hypothetical protein
MLRKTALLGFAVLIAVAGFSSPIGSDPGGLGIPEAGSFADRFERTTESYVFCCCETKNGICCGKAYQCGGYIPGCPCISPSYPQ